MHHAIVLHLQAEQLSLLTLTGHEALEPCTQPTVCAIAQLPLRSGYLRANIDYARFIQFG